MLPQNVAPWRIEYFKLKEFEKWYDLLLKHVIMCREKWGARGWSRPRPQASPWDRLTSVGSWLHAGKNSRVSHSKVTAGLFREIHIP